MARVRVRSPAYPALSLPAAVDVIRKVHSLQQVTPEPRDVVIKHMGYSAVSGRSLKAISALIKYGFLEKQGKEGLRVSDRAIAILYPDPEHPDKREKELNDAAREPTLFNDIFDRWKGRPSEESLKAFLIRRGFNMNSVENVARAFYETFDLVSGLGDSYDSADNDQGDQDEWGEEEPDMRKGDAGKDDGNNKPPPPAGLNITKPIFDFETVKIQTEIDNQEDLGELISRLEQIKSMLPSKTEH